jgi:hypothetical protein
MSVAIRARMVSRVSRLSLAIAVSVAVWGLTAAPLSWATDKLAAPGAAKGQETTITVRPDGEAGEFGRQGIDILHNGTVTCGRLELKSAIFARVIGHITFPTVEFGSCVYLGNRARLNRSSCDVVITSGGLGKFTSRDGKRCDFRIEVPGCTVHLGKGPFLELGYHNTGSPAETTALTEPYPFGGTAVGAACLSPGPSAIGQYRGYLRLAASRNGAKKPFTVIL